MDRADKADVAAPAPQLTPPTLWYTASKERAVAGEIALLEGAPMGTMVEMSYAEATKAKRTLTQKQVLEKARVDGAKIMFQLVEGPVQLNGLEVEVLTVLYTVMTIQCTVTYGLLPYHI